MSRSTKFLAAVGAAFLMPLFVAVVAPQVVTSASAFAEDEKPEPKYKNVQTRQRQSVGATCGKALEKVQPDLEAENWKGSLVLLK